jgi:hypothetical protein
MESKSVFNYLLSFFLLLTIVAYYLGANGKVNNFPTYALGLLALYAVIFQSEVRTYFAKSRVLQLSALLLCYFAASAFWSPDLDWIKVGKAFGAVPLVLGFVLSIIICCRSNEGFLPLCLKLLVLASFVSAIYSIYLYHTLHLLPFYEDRIYAMGRLGSPVIAALSYGVASLMALQLLLRGSDSAQRLGWSVVEAVLIYIIYKTGTISVWVGLVPAWIVLFSIHFKAGPRRIIGWLSLALVMSLICITGLFYVDGELFTSLFPRAGSFRPEIWSTALSLTVDHNLFFGFGHLDSGNLMYKGESFHHAHSIYLASFYYGGLVGLLILLVLVSNSFAVALGEAFNGKFSDQTAAQSSSSPDSSDWNLSTLAALCLTLLVYGCVVFAFDGDRLLEKVHMIWIVFWLPVGLAALVEVKAVLSYELQDASYE